MQLTVIWYHSIFCHFSRGNHLHCGNIYVRARVWRPSVWIASILNWILFYNFNPMYFSLDRYVNNYTFLLFVKITLFHCFFFLILQGKCILFAAWNRHHSKTEMIKTIIFDRWGFCIVLYCIVLYCIELYWRGGHCCPIHCDLFKIYCAPPNLGITWTWICRLNFAQRPIFSGLRFFNEPEISDSGPPA